MNKAAFIWVYFNPSLNADADYNSRLMALTKADERSKNHDMEATFLFSVVQNSQRFMAPATHDSSMLLMDSPRASGN